MIWIIFLAFVLIIFPIYLKFDLHVENKPVIYYQFSLYGLINFFYGRVKFNKNKLEIYGNLIKNKVLRYKDIINFRSKIKPLKDYHLISFSSMIELGDSDNILKPLSCLFVLDNVSNIIKPIVWKNKPYLIINNQLNIYQDKNLFNVYIKSACMLNILMIILSIFKILMEKVFNGFRKK